MLFRLKNQHHIILLATLCLLVVLLVFFETVQSASSDIYFNINKNKSETSVRKVTLYISAPDGTKKMKISNKLDFDNIDWESYAKTKKWYLDYGKGTKTVYIKFKGGDADEEKIYKDTITLSVPENMEVNFIINDGDEETDSRSVSLDISFSKSVESIFVSNQEDFSLFDFMPITKKISWMLSAGSGQKKVYMQFKDADGKTKIISKTIQYNQSPTYIPEGSLIKGKNTPIYYLGFDGYIHPFSHPAVLHSWYDSISNIFYVSNPKISQYLVGKPICVRAGTWLVSFDHSPKVYAPEPGCQLRPIRSEVEAKLLYGNNWDKRVITLESSQSSFYQIRSYDVGDKDIVDKDHDGVDSETEKEYGTSDLKHDSDGDGLTDHEEIFYWFTDPDIKDTTGNGFSDLADALSGNLLSGLEIFSSAGYQYPRGSVVKHPNKNQIYYQYIDDLFYAISGNIGGKVFSSNNFHKKFVIYGSSAIGMKLKSKGSIKAGTENIKYPTLLGKNNSLHPL